MRVTVYQLTVCLEELAKIRTFTPEQVDFQDDCKAVIAFLAKSDDFDDNDTIVEFC